MSELTVGKIEQLTTAPTAPSPLQSAVNPLVIWHSADKELPPPDQNDRLIMYVTGEYDFAYWVDPYWRCNERGRVNPSDGMIAYWMDIPPIPSR